MQGWGCEPRRQPLRGDSGPAAVPSGPGGPPRAPPSHVCASSRPFLWPGGQQSSPWPGALCVPSVSPLPPSQVVRSPRGSLVPRAAGWSRLRCAAVSSLPLVLVFAVPALHPAPHHGPGQRRSRWAREGSLVGRGPEGGRVGCARARAQVCTPAGGNTDAQHVSPCKPLLPRGVLGGAAAAAVVLGNRSQDCLNTQVGISLKMDLQALVPGPSLVCTGCFHVFPRGPRSTCARTLLRNNVFIKVSN